MHNFIRFIGLSEMCAKDMGIPSENLWSTFPLSGVSLRFVDSRAVVPHTKHTAIHSAFHKLRALFTGVLACFSPHSTGPITSPSLYKKYYYLLLIV